MAPEKPHKPLQPVSVLPQYRTSYEQQPGVTVWCQQFDKKRKSPKLFKWCCSNFHEHHFFYFYFFKGDDIVSKGSRKILLIFMRRLQNVLWTFLWDSPRFLIICDVIRWNDPTLCDGALYPEQSADAVLPSASCRGHQRMHHQRRKKWTRATRTTRRSKRWDHFHKHFPLWAGSISWISSTKHLSISPYGWGLHFILFYVIIYFWWWWCFMRCCCLWLHQWWLLLLRIMFKN